MMEMRYTVQGLGNQAQSEFLLAIINVSKQKYCQSGSGRPLNGSLLDLGYGGHAMVFFSIAFPSVMWITPITLVVLVHQRDVLPLD